MKLQSQPRKYYKFLVLVLVLIKDHLNHQKDAHPKGIRIPGFLSYDRVYKLTQENACCLRLQPHFYPTMVVIGLGRGDELRRS